MLRKKLQPKTPLNFMIAPAREINPENRSSSEVFVFSHFSPSLLVTCYLFPQRYEKNERAKMRSLKVYEKKSVRQRNTSIPSKSRLQN
jgi:hypothetical protein